MPAMSEPKTEVRESPAVARAESKHPAPATDHPPHLRDEEMRLAQDLMFFAYRDFTNAADVILEELGLGRAHHRALHFIGRNPGITVSDLLGILRITKQSLARVLNVLVERGYVSAPADTRTGGRDTGTAAVREPAGPSRRGVPRGRRAGRRRFSPGHAPRHG
jgi:hypothetical protein